MRDFDELELLELESEVEEPGIAPAPEPEVRPDSMRAPQSLGANLEVLGDTMWESMIKMAGDYSRGIQNLVAPFRDDTDRIQQELSYEQSQADKKFAPYQEANPIAARIAPFVTESLPATRTLKGAAIIEAGLQGLKYKDSIADQLFSGATGALGGLLGQAAGDKIVKGFKRDPRSQRLMDQGLTTQTVGEQWGPGLSSTEEKLVSTPGLGRPVNRAKNRSVDAFHRNRIDNALQEIQTRGAAGDVRMPEATPVSTMPVDGLPVDPRAPQPGITGPSDGPIPGLDTPPRDLVPVGPYDTNLPPQQELMTMEGYPDMGDLDPNDIPADYAEWEPTTPELSAGMKLPDEVASGGDAMRYANRQISDEYNEVLKDMDFQFDDKFLGDYSKAYEEIQTLPDNLKNLVNRELENTLHRRSKDSGGLSGNAWKEVDTQLRDRARKMSMLTQDPVTQEAGRYLSKIQKSLKEQVLRANPNVADRFRGAERAFAKMRVNEAAAAKIGAEDQIFSPTHYLQEVRKNTDPRLYSQGMGYEQKFAEDAKATISPKVNNSGSADRFAIYEAIKSGALVSPTALPMILGGNLLGGKKAQETISGLLFDRPDYPMKKIVEELTRRGGRTAGGDEGGKGAKRVRGLLGM